MLVSNPDKDSVDPSGAIAMAIVAVLAFYTIHAMNTGFVKTSTGWSMPDLPEGLVSLLTGATVFTGGQDSPPELGEAT